MAHSTHYTTRLLVVLFSLLSIRIIHVPLIYTCVVHTAQLWNFYLVPHIPDVLAWCVVCAECEPNQKLKMIFGKRL